MINLSKRAINFPQNPIRGLEPIIQEVKKNGVNIIPLNIGAPDTNFPQEFKNSISEFLNNSKSIPYGPSIGNSKLLTELSKFYIIRLNFNNISEKNIAITQGASEALDLVLYSIADVGDTIATFDPAYPNYLSIAYKHNIKVHPIETTLESGFHFNHNSLSKQIPQNCKAIIWSSPCNPTGAVFNKAELNALLQLSRERNIWLIADEVYRSLDFSSKNTGLNRSLSILDLATPTDRERIIVLDSMSKLLGLCGARIGTIISHEEVINNLVQQASVRGSASTLSQAGVESINNISDDFFQNYLKTFKERRDFVYDRLVSLKISGIKVSPTPPEGAFYIITDIGVNSYDFAKWIITDFPSISKTNETIFLTPMTTPNGGFYINKDRGINEVRIAYVIDIKLLDKALTILEKALNIYRKLK